jgi:hypothetical protein
MEFIEGYTLGEYLQHLRKTVSLDKQISHGSKVFILLTKALSYYETLKTQIVHGDLTPRNVLVVVEDDKITPKDIRLIDFGPNYILQETIGNRRLFTEAFSQTELFSAPEIIERRQEPSVKSDLYSLGMLGLDLLSLEPLSSDRIGERLEEIWQNPATAGIAQLIEDLIDDSPNNRALVLSTGGTDQFYSTLGALVEEQASIYRDVIRKSRAPIELGSLIDIKLLPEILRSIATVWIILKSKKSPFKTATRSMIVCSILNGLAELSIIVLFFAYTILDINEYFQLDSAIPLSNILIRLTEHIPRNFHIGDLYGNLPGRCIALTFSIVAVRYYANIFASLRLVDFQHWLRPLTNFFLRAVSVSYFFPIAAAIAYDPQLWPFCSALGAFFPAINNLCCYYCAVSSAKYSSTSFTIEKFHKTETARFLKVYRSWWVLMTYYSLGLLSIGILLRTKYAADAAVYAYFLSVLNLVQINKNNCTRDAPLVVGHLSRLFFSLRRWQLAKNANCSPKTI